MHKIRRCVIDLLQLPLQLQRLLHLLLQRPDPPQPRIIRHRPIPQRLALLRTPHQLIQHRVIPLKPLIQTLKIRRIRHMHRPHQIHLHPTRPRHLHHHRLKPRRPILILHKTHVLRRLLLLSPHPTLQRQTHPQQTQAPHQNTTHRAPHFPNTRSKNAFISTQDALSAFSSYAAPLDGSFPAIFCVKACTAPGYRTK